MTTATQLYALNATQAHLRDEEVRHLKAMIAGKAQEIARLEAQVARLEADKEQALNTIDDNYIIVYLNAIALERWINEHLAPKMRTRADAKWLIDQLDPHEELGFMIHSQQQMLMTVGTPELEEKIQSQVHPVLRGEHVVWGSWHLTTLFCCSSVMNIISVSQPA